jgi:hypothetical protein
MSGVITFGTSYVGKVGRGYVVTKVFQIVNLPLIPLGGYVVREGSETETFVRGLWEFDGRPVPISWRSFAWAWARVILFAGAILNFPGLLGHKLGLPPGWHFVLHGPLLSIAMIVVWAKTRRGLRASPVRATQLEGQLAQLPVATATRRSGRTSGRAR